MNAFIQVSGKYKSSKISRSTPVLITKRSFCQWFIGWTFFSFPFFLQAAIIYVNPTAAGSNNGTSWDNGFTSLSSALLAATNGDEIWVKHGVYKPLIKVDINNNGAMEIKEVTFQIPNGVALYGGFAGIEVIREQRDIKSNLTILSGDIDNNDVNIDANAIAEKTGDIIGNNAFHVIYTSNVSAATRVDGFCITAGKALSTDIVTDANQNGGAWYNNVSSPVNASSPTIANLVFQGNYAASEGGAIYNKNAAAGGTVLSLIKDCKFIGNKSDLNGGAIYYGSFKAGNYQPHITGCEFKMNEAYRRGGAIYSIGDHAIIDSSWFRNNKVTAISPNGNTFVGSGGGVGLLASSAAFSHCMFEGNSATGNPTGPMEGGGGGAVHISIGQSETINLGVSSPQFIDCGFYYNISSGNTTSWGGAIVHISDAGQLRPKYVNCVFAGNQAQNDGGALANYTRIVKSDIPGYVPDLTVNITNCTFVLNNAGKKGGAIYTEGYLWMSKQLMHVKVENSIVWNNTAGTSSPEIYADGENIIASSLIKGSGGSGGGWKPAFGTDGGNNIDVDPKFMNVNDPDGADNIPATSDDGLKLASGAPPVNKGNNAAVGLAGITKDFVSAARINSGKVDMGAYERTGYNNAGSKTLWLSNWNSDPVCLSCSWAFVFNNKLFQHFIWDGPAQMTVKDGSTMITGHIVNRDNKRMGFEVNLKLINEQDWERWSAEGRMYTAISPEAIQAAIRNHKDWTFWELSENSYLKGTGELAGQIDLHPLPANNKTGFQLGEGANGWDKDLGVSGSFTYDGMLTYQGSRTILRGLASMNADAVTCIEGCASITDKIAIKTENTANKLSSLSTSQKPDLSIFPIPAHSQFQISQQALPSGRYTVNIYNAIGQVQRRENLFITNGTATIQVKNLSPGYYIIQLVSGSGKTISKKLIIE